MAAPGTRIGVHRLALDHRPAWRTNHHDVAEGRGFGGAPAHAPAEQLHQQLHAVAAGAPALGPSGQLVVQPIQTTVHGEPVLPVQLPSTSGEPAAAQEDVFKLGGLKKRSSEALEAAGKVVCRTCGHQKAFGKWGQYHQWSALSGSQKVKFSKEVVCRVPVDVRTSAARLEVVERMRRRKRAMPRCDRKECNK